MILLDTCALLWWTLQPESLSAPAISACSDINKEGGCISSITLWEIGIKWKKKTLDLTPIDLREYLHRIEKIENLTIISVSSSIWVESIMLDWEHRDPADRVIVATAQIYNIPIITKDKYISNYYQKVIW